MTTSIVEQVKQAGVIGAGGAGFPTYVKLESPVDTYLCNAAECEPLLYKDQELMRLDAERMVRGMRIAMEQVGATRGVIAVKGKYDRAIAALKEHAGPDIEFHYFGNFYPSGDEYVVVTEVTGRLIPVGGLPKDVGCAVNNVETFINIAAAADGQETENGFHGRGLAGTIRADDDDYLVRIDMHGDVLKDVGVTVASGDAVHGKKRSHAASPVVSPK